MKSFTKCTERDNVPILNIKVPIDEAETRPESIDEW
jgi:hypothetical protein